MPPFKPNGSRVSTISIKSTRTVIPSGGNARVGGNTNRNGGVGTKLGHTFKPRTAKDSGSKKK